MLDFWQEIYGTVRRNKLRTALTGFSVAWGIFILIVLLGFGNGLINSFKSQSDGLSSNSMMVGGSSTDLAYGGFEKGRTIDLRDKEIGVSNEMTDHIENASGIAFSPNMSMSYEGEYFNLPLMGVNPSYVDTESPEILTGRFINTIDMKQCRRVLVINENHSKLFFKDPQQAVGKELNVGGLLYKVVGVYKGKGNQSSNDMYAPFSTVRRLQNHGNKIGRIIFSVKNLSSKAESDAFEKDYRRRIAKSQGYSPEDTRGIWVWNRLSNYLDQMKGFGYLTTAIWVIGIFTLISGIVGVSNIMLITVKERTREFGIRKALGARPMSILWLIIAESVAITAFFGYIGLLTGIGVTEWVNAVMGTQTMNAGVFQMSYFKDPTVDIGIAVQATLTLIVCGTLAGLFPALKAVKIPPIEALRAD
ncbi:MAG: ABC transporter permease [Bacteroidaceae bacterium]